MKKLLSALLLATCIFGLTACGSEEAAITYDEQSVQMLSQTIYDLASSEYDAAMMEEIRGYDEYEWSQLEAMWRSQIGLKINGETVIGAINSWQSSADAIGSAEGIGDITIRTEKENIIAVVPIKGSEHDAEMEIVYDSRLAVESVTLGVDYSFSELMGTAALNTLLGMGTVFSVLILISLIISCFVFIPKLQAALTKKPSKEEVKTSAVDNTIAQIIEKEELVDDTELIAVIAAAIAASEGAVSADGFVVRSIKRANRRTR